MVIQRKEIFDHFVVKAKMKERRMMMELEEEGEESFIMSEQNKAIEQGTETGDRIKECPRHFMCYTRNKSIFLQ